MCQYKAMTGDKLGLRDYNEQFGESQARVAALNKMTGLSMPAGEMIC